MNEYKLVCVDEDGLTIILRYDGEVYIPSDERSRRWREYLEYVDNGGITDPIMSVEEEKDTAYTDIIDSINKRNSEENLKDFDYTVDGVVYSFYADVDSLSTVEGNCLSKIQRGAVMTDPVPAPSGVWKTTGTDSNGILPQYVPMTIEEFLGLTDTLTERGISNFSTKEYHKNRLKILYTDGAYSASDLLEYDFSTGWV